MPWVLVTHEGHGEGTRVHGVYETEGLAKDALVAAKARAKLAWMPHDLYGHTEYHEVQR